MVLLSPECPFEDCLDIILADYNFIVHTARRRIVLPTMEEVNDNGGTGCFPKGSGSFYGDRFDKVVE